jgi:hypothetical protein
VTGVRHRRAAPAGPLDLLAAAERVAAAGIIVAHRGGGWWQGECMGQAKRCRAGECKHLALRVGSRAVRRMPNISERAAAPSNQELGR